MLGGEAAYARKTVALWPMMTYERLSWNTDRVVK